MQKHGIDRNRHETEETASQDCQVVDVEHCFTPGVYCSESWAVKKCDENKSRQCRGHGDRAAYHFGPWMRQKIGVSEEQVKHRKLDNSGHWMRRSEGAERQRGREAERKRGREAERQIDGKRGRQIGRERPREN